MGTLYYFDTRNPGATLFVKQQFSPEEEEESRSNNDDNCSVDFQSGDLRMKDDLPPLTIRFIVRTHHTTHIQQEIHRKSLCLSLDPPVYTSHDSFYSFVQESLDNNGDWGEVFDREFRHFVVHDMIFKIQALAGDESNKALRNLEVVAGICVFLNPHRLEISQTEVDNPTANNETPICVVCLEEIGKKKLLRMPCSHMFHTFCWLDLGAVQLKTHLPNRKALPWEMPWGNASTL